MRAGWGREEAAWGLRLGLEEEEMSVKGWGLDLQRGSWMLRSLERKDADEAVQREGGEAHRLWDHLTTCEGTRKKKTDRCSQTRSKVAHIKDSLTFW